MKPLRAFGACLAAGLVSASGRAQAPVELEPVRVRPADRWSFEVVPYLWMASLDGSIDVGNLPEVEVDASFGDLLENLDFAAAAFASARRGRWVLMSDLSYTALEIEEAVAGSNVENDSSITWISLAGGATIGDGDRCVDLFAGARYTSVNTDAESTGGVSASRTKNEAWLDPVVGFNARIETSSGFAFGLLADIGGFGVGSDLTFEVMPTAAYSFNDAISLRAGYRWMDTDFEDGDFTYDMVQSGWILGLGFAF